MSVYGDPEPDSAATASSLSPAFRAGQQYNLTQTNGTISKKHIAIGILSNHPDGFFR
jgi:hypothetical protein